MPNGGSDCCGECQFYGLESEKYLFNYPKRIDYPHCLLRAYVPEDPYYTYCVNHPHHNPYSVTIPVGPIYVPGKDLHTRKPTFPCLDSEKIRQGLLMILERIPEKPRKEYPSSTNFDAEIIKQVGHFKELRALNELLRIIKFDPNLKLEWHYFDRKYIIAFAVKAVAELLEEESFPLIKKYILLGRKDKDPEELATIRYHTLIPFIKYGKDNPIAEEALSIATSDPSNGISGIANNYIAGKIESQSLLNRFKGCLLGFAIGDSLGKIVEGRVPPHPIYGYQPWNDLLPYKNQISYTDDTQLTIALCNTYIFSGKGDPHVFGKEILKIERIFGIGNATKQALNRLKAGIPATESGVNSGGNGALMRSIPIALSWLKRYINNNDLGWIDDVRSTGKVTHTQPIAISSSIGFVWFLMKILNSSVDDFVKHESKISVLNELADFIRSLPEDRHAYEPRNPKGKGSSIRLSDRIDSDHYPSVKTFISKRRNLESFNSTFYSGAFALETLPFCIMSFLAHYDSPIDIVFQSISWSKDADTIGALSASLAGAMYGIDFMPKSWLNSFKEYQQIEKMAETLYTKFYSE